MGVFDDVETLDKQFVYYIFKIGDMITFESEEKITMMGNSVTEMALLEKFKFSKESLIMIQTTEFWGTYYRHNNYFYDNNKSILKRIRPEWATKGIEKKISMMEESGSGFDDDDKKFFSQVLDEKEGILSRWGVRASSLNDIIRYMVYLRFKLSIINKVCKEITKRYEMDKELAYKVFKETEDEFTIRDYVKMEEDTPKKKEIEVIDCFSKCLEYLQPKEALEMILGSKKIYSALKKEFHCVALRKYDLTKEERVGLWKCLIPEVRLIF